MATTRMRVLLLAGQFGDRVRRPGHDSLGYVDRGVPTVGSLFPLHLVFGDGGTSVGDRGLPGRIEFPDLAPSCDGQFKRPRGYRGGDSRSGPTGQRLFVIAVVGEGHTDLDGLAHVGLSQRVSSAGGSLNVRIGGPVVANPLVREAGVGQPILIGDACNVRREGLAYLGRAVYGGLARGVGVWLGPLPRLWGRCGNDSVLPASSVKLTVTLMVSPPLNLIADDGKELVVRLAAMYALVLCVSLIARFETHQETGRGGRGAPVAAGNASSSHTPFTIRRRSRRT